MAIYRCSLSDESTYYVLRQLLASAIGDFVEETNPDTDNQHAEHHYANNFRRILNGVIQVDEEMKLESDVSGFQPFPYGRTLDQNDLRTWQ